MAAQLFKDLHELQNIRQLCIQSVGGMRCEKPRHFFDGFYNWWFGNAVGTYVHWKPSRIIEISCYAYITYFNHALPRCSRRLLISGASVLIRLASALLSNIGEVQVSIMERLKRFISLVSRSLWKCRRWSYNTLLDPERSADLWLAILLYRVWAVLPIYLCPHTLHLSW